MKYVANARMYSVNPAAAAAWKQFFAWLSKESGVDLDIVDHAFPLPLGDLWSRPNLGCAFMCGFPYTLMKKPPKLVGAPIPIAAPIPGRAVYATHLIVAADSPFKNLKDTFGGRLGYTVEDSHSGYNALRHHLQPYYLKSGANLFSKSIGPLYTPRRVVEAVLAHDIDIGPLDNYAYELMIHYEPELEKCLRIVATTDAAPIPALVASTECPDDVVQSLQKTLMTFGEASACAGLRDRLCLEGFVRLQASDYALILEWDAEARKASYPHPN